MNVCLHAQLARPDRKCLLALSQASTSEFLGMFSACLLALILRDSAALAPTGIVGDQVPPPYPVLDVHVPEPVASMRDRRRANEQQNEKSRLLHQLMAKLHVISLTLWVANKTVFANAAELAENAIFHWRVFKHSLPVFLNARYTMTNKAALSRNFK